MGPKFWSIATLIVGFGTLVLLGSLCTFFLSIGSHTLKLTTFNSIATAVVFAIETSSPNGFFSAKTTTFALPFFGLSLGLNIWLTLMIVIRMLYHRRESRKIFGPKHGTHYGSISSIFIESAGLYAISSILLLATYAPQHPINQIWLGLEPFVQVSTIFIRRSHSVGSDHAVFCRR